MRQILNSTQISRLFTGISRDAQEILPHLIRKLITATVPPDNIGMLQIPAGDEISRSGYDGRVQNSMMHPFVPTGASVWEMGTGDPVSKFSKDYENRTKNLEIADAKVTTFVFITPHRWTSKETEARQRANERQWRDVRILDNSDLETWLESAPSTARWLAEQMGVPVHGLDDIETYRKVLNAKYRFPISTELLIAGRVEAQASVQSWVSGRNEIQGVRGESFEEVAAFLCAAIDSFPDVKERDRALATALIVYEPAAIDFLAGCPTPTIVIPVGVNAARRARAKSCSTLRTIDVTIRRSGLEPDDAVTIRLGLVRRQATQEALEKMGIPDFRAGRIAQECKGSLTAALTMLAGPDEPFPWTSGKTAVKLAGLVLAGQWQADRTEDRSAVAELLGADESALDMLVAEWAGPLGPLIKRAGMIDWVAWDFAWLQLSEHFDVALLNRFTAVAIRVLSASHPSLELPLNTRWSAGILGKQLPNSSGLISGLINSIVLLALYSDQLPSLNGQWRVNALVKQLIGGMCKNRGAAWYTLAPWLPDFAEAAPEEFAAAVDSLILDQAAFNTVFAEEGHLGRSPHTHLLWALERLAWSSTHLGRATVLLGKLAAKDPGGQLANRPIHSLREIFLPWKPSTAADLDTQLSALDALNETEPLVAWDLFRSLLPRSHDVASPTDRPRWRAWAAEISANSGASVVHYWKIIEALVCRLVHHAADDASRWAELLKAYADLWRGYPELGKELIAALSRRSIELWKDADKAILIQATRQLIHWHRENAEAKWALPTEALVPLDKLTLRAVLADVIVKNEWLFCHHVEIDAPRGDWQEREKRLRALRRSAVSEVLTAVGLDGVTKLANRVDTPFSVGFALGEIGLSDEFERDFLVHSIALLPDQPKPGDKAVELVHGYMAIPLAGQGLSWLVRTKQRHDIKWTVDGLVSMLLGIQPSLELWTLLEGWGTDVADKYWSNTRMSYLLSPDKELAIALRRLLDCQRFYHALDLAGMHARSGRSPNSPLLRPALIEEILSGAVRTDPRAEVPPTSLSMLGHNVSELLDDLEDCGITSEKLVLLEWGWLAVLDQTPRGVKALKNALCENPKLFVELLELAYKADDEPTRKLSDTERAAGLQAHKVLGGMNQVPGCVTLAPTARVEGDVGFIIGSMTAEILQEWLISARSMAHDVKRLGVCDSHIGQILAFSPADAKDNAWPCEALRHLIEEINSPELFNGLVIGVFNKRGIHFIEPGGKQELRLEAKFREYADIVRTKWPRTCQALLEIAQGFHDEAKQWIEREKFEEFE